MINAKAYSSYFGGKGGNGTYQAIINHVPPLTAYYSLYLGNCGVTRRIKPAKVSFLNDIDPDVIKAWESLELPVNYCLHNLNAIDVLKGLQDGRDIELTFGVPASERFILLDPPYRMDSRKSKANIYKFEVDEKHHSDLASQIVAMIDHKIMLCHYPDPFYDEVLAGWHTYDYMSMTRNGLVRDRIYYNYDLSNNLLHDYSYIGKNFRQREAWERKRLNFIKKLNELPELLRNSILSDITSHK